MKVCADDELMSARKVSKPCKLTELEHISVDNLKSLAGVRTHVSKENLVAITFTRTKHVGLGLSSS